jgi:hypothetical protein
MRSIEGMLTENVRAGGSVPRLVKLAHEFIAPGTLFQQRLREVFDFAAWSMGLIGSETISVDKNHTSLVSSG